MVLRRHTPQLNTLVHSAISSRPTSPIQPHPRSTSRSATASLLGSRVGSPATTCSGRSVAGRPLVSSSTLSIGGRASPHASSHALCSAVRDAGGGFLKATYTDDVAGFYERVAIGGPVRECHLSAKAFTAVANLAGSSAREIAAHLPDPELNFIE